MKFLFGVMGFLMILSFTAPNSFVNKDGVIIHKPTYSANNEIGDKNESKRD